MFLLQIYKRLHAFKASKGYIAEWASARGIANRKEAGEGDSVPAEVLEKGRADLQSLTKQYAAKDIFNADEFAWFWKRVPDHTLAKGTLKVQGVKKLKDRVTGLVCFSALGEKVELTVIGALPTRLAFIPHHLRVGAVAHHYLAISAAGKSKNPKCFKKHKVSANNLPVRYRFTKKAWMTRVEFIEWLTTLNEDMKRQNRHILLLLDNCKVHKDCPVLSNVRVEFLPKNTTSHLQPADAGMSSYFVSPRIASL